MSVANEIISLTDIIEVRERVREVQARRGQNRGDAENAQIDADDDLAAVGAWLAATGSGSPDTHRTYLKEARRFVTWLSIDRGIPLSGVKAPDLHSYKSFLFAPEPSSLWCNSIDNGGLGLFRGGLAEKSANHALVILRGLFRFLTDNGYLRGNPFSAFGRIKYVASDERGQTYESNRPLVNQRDIPGVWIDAMFQGLNQKKESTVDIRRLWVFVLHAYTGLRRSESVKLSMSSFTQTEEGWFIAVIGKGKKHRLVPAPGVVIEVLKLYREKIGATGPLINDDTPAIKTLRGEDRYLSSSQIYRVIKEIADIGCNVLLEKGESEHAARLMSFTPHLFRRRYVTKMLRDKADILEVSRIVGHENVSTTQIYGVESAARAAKLVNTSFGDISLTNNLEREETEK